MVFQCLFISKTLLTFITLEWFQAGVDQHMWIQTSFSETTILAQCTFVTFLPSVRLFMNFHTVSIFKCFPTHFATNRLLTCMKILNMFIQSMFGAKCYWTILAQIRWIAIKMNFSVSRAQLVWKLWESGQRPGLSPDQLSSPLWCPPPTCRLSKGHVYYIHSKTQHHT